MILDRKEILEIIKETLVATGHHAVRKIYSIDEQSDLYADIGISSIDMMYIAVTLGTDFGVDSSSFSDENIKTVKDIIDIVEEAEK